MPIELKIPEVGESITEVQIADWLKAEGDAVRKDEPLVMIDSQKTTFELPAPADGTLSKILRQAGETVNVGEVIGHLQAGTQAVEGAETKPDKAVSDGPKPSPNPAEKSPSPPAEPEVSSPAARDAAGGEGESTETQPEENRPAILKDETTEPPISQSSEAKDDGTKLSGNVTSKSQLAAEPSASRPPSGMSPSRPSSPEEKIVPMSMLRRTVARRLVEARLEMAMVSTFNEVDMSAVQKLRHDHQEEFTRRHGVKLGLMSFFAKAAVDALKQFPLLNAEVRGNDLVYRNFFNIGIAIATERGLVVPVLRHAEMLSFAEVEKAIGAFAKLAKEGKLAPKDLEGATFTITNGGVFGSLLSTPIISPPQTGILGMHTIQDRPVAVQGQVVIRPMMYLALTYDHRAVDGREAVLFLRRLQDVIETPARMLLEV